jgi:hypothetical protein
VFVRNVTVGKGGGGWMTTVVEEFAYAKLSSEGHQRDVKSSNEDLRERIQIFDQQNHSPSLQSFPASTSLELMTVGSTRQENAESEMPKTCKRRW